MLINVFYQYTSQLKIQPPKWAQGRKRSRMLDYAQFRELALDFQSCQKLTTPYRSFVMPTLFGSAELIQTVCSEYPYTFSRSYADMNIPVTARVHTVTLQLGPGGPWLVCCQVRDPGRFLTARPHEARHLMWCLGFVFRCYYYSGLTWVTASVHNPPPSLWGNVVKVKKLLWEDDEDDLNL